MLDKLLGARGKTDPSRTDPLGDVLKECQKAFWLTAALTMMVELLSIAPVLYMMNMYDRVMTSRSEVTLISLTILILGLYLFWSSLEWLRTRLMVRISMRMDWDLACATFDAAFRAHVGRQKIDVHQMLGDLLLVRQFLTGQAVLAFMSAPFALVFMGISALMHVYLAVFVLVASSLLLLASWVTQRFTTPLIRQANEAKAEANRLAAQTLQLSETALALGMQPLLRKRWYLRHQGFLGAQAHASEAGGVLGGLSGFLQKAFPSLQMALGIYLAIEGLITGGMVIAATTLISKALAPIQKLLLIWPEVVSARQSFERLEKLLQEDEQHLDRLSLPVPRGQLSLTQVMVIPQGAKQPVLQGIHFEMAPGEVTAIIGPSASGKSSLVRLLVGIWKPTSGAVRLDDASVFDWVRQDLGGSMGYVPQEIAFLEGTVAQNIARMGTVDDAKVVAAAQMAQLHEIILKFPNGYETMLGESGYALTGGQKQKLAVARAVYGQPSYLVMDEPNAAMDEVGERGLIEMIRDLKAQGTTVLFTTHRPNLLVVADNVLVLSQGRQAGYGPVALMMAAAKQKIQSEQVQILSKVAAA
jgi:PrtD family type I secretion system ABC transporter